MLIIIHKDGLSAYYCFIYYRVKVQTISVAGFLHLTVLPEPVPGLQAPPRSQYLDCAPAKMANLHTCFHNPNPASGVALSVKIWGFYRSLYLLQNVTHGLHLMRMRGWPGYANHSPLETTTMKAAEATMIQAKAAEATEATVSTAPYCGSNNKSSRSDTNENRGGSSSDQNKQGTQRKRRQEMTEVRAPRSSSIYSLGGTATYRPRRVLTQL